MLSLFSLYLKQQSSQSNHITVYRLNNDVKNATLNLK